MTLSLDKFVTTRWNNMQSRVRSPGYRKKGVKICFSREEFYDWCAKGWADIKALHLAGKVPSIDRINSSGSYEFSNIRVIDRIENMRRPRTGMGMGRKFSDNVCENIPVDERKKVKIAVSLDSEIEEQAWVLARYGNVAGFNSVSAIVNHALELLFEGNGEVELAYLEWKRRSK